MNCFALILLFTAVLYASAAPDPRCASICGWDTYFSEATGYGCSIDTNGDVLCSCPGGSIPKRNTRCRLCPDACNININNPIVKACLEYKDYGTGFTCLCEDSRGLYNSVDSNCARAAEVTTRATPTTTTGSGGGGGVGSPCANGGVLVNGACQCPSGYGGQFCNVFDPSGLCRNVICKNDGVCAIRSPSGQYVSVCLCRYGTWGEYCELNGTLGLCSANPCLNGGACQENVVGTTRHAYCRCQPGFKGIKCETPYFFPCPYAGNFLDVEMAEQGKYFTCTTNAAGSLRLEQKSCAKGLRFNPSTQQCGY